MKRLYLIRHAKSSWSDPLLADFDRGLNKRGKRDAPFMGGRLAEAGICPDLMIASSARRARKTAVMLCREIGYDKKKLLFTDRIYTSEMLQLLEVIRMTGDENLSLGLVGHNFVITELAEWLTGETIMSIPTCGIVGIEFAVMQWRDVGVGNGRMLFFDYPKKHSGRSRQKWM